MRNTFIISSENGMDFEDLACFISCYCEQQHTEVKRNQRRKAIGLDNGIKCRLVEIFSDIVTA